MTGAARIRTVLRRLGIAEASFLELCRVAGHAAGRLEELPGVGATDPFDPYYSVRDVAARLGFCERTIRRRIQSGEFGPLEHLLLDHETRIPWSAVAAYLRAHGRQPIELQVRRVEARIDGAGVCRPGGGQFKRKVKQ